MRIDREFAYILILLSVPLQFNLYTDSWDLIFKDMKIGWTKKKELTYYENYFGKKITMYTGLVSSIIFIFIFYKARKVKLILSIVFVLNAITWLIYLGVNENRIYLAYCIRAIQGIYLSCFHILSLPYIMIFTKNSKKCFCGCLIQFSMFLGLLLMNILFVSLSWQIVVIIFCILSFTFSGLIWLVPEMYIKPKSSTNEYINKRENFRLLIIMLIAMLLQQLSGIGILLEQLSRVLKGIGLDLDSHIQACLFDFVGAIAVINSAFMTDIVSTRYMWCISALGLCIGLAIYGATLKTNLENWISSLSVFFYFLFYGLGEGPIPWYLNGTMFSENVRIESSGINLFWNLFLSPLMDYLWWKIDERFNQFGSILFASVSCFISIFYGLFVIPPENKEDDNNINIL